MVFKRVVAALALVVVVLGCGGDATLQLGEPVQLLPGYPFTPGATKACYTVNFTGSLVVDPEYGTAFQDDDPRSPRAPGPVRWPQGYTARRAGSEVVVLDEKGQTVAVTGRRYRIEPADTPPTDDPPRAFDVCVPLNPL